MKLRKWNPKTEVYEDFNSPADRIFLFTPNMAELIDCTNCGRELTFGDSYTSKTIHTPAGIGYPVCDKCYGLELSDINLGI